MREADDGGDALQHVRENRQEMVAAGLIILRGFIAAGSPRATPDKLGSYEVFDTLIRQCVIWLGRSGVAPVTDPAASMAKAKALVPELQKLTAFLLSVHAVMGERKWRIAELIAKANNMAIADLDGQALTDALTQIAGNDVGRINAHILGAWITKQVDRRCGALRVERAGVYASGLLKSRAFCQRASAMLHSPFSLRILRAKLLALAKMPGLHLMRLASSISETSRT